MLSLDAAGLKELGVTDQNDVLRMLQIKDELYMLGGKVITKVITPFPLPPPPETYLGAAKRDQIYDWDEQQVQAFLLLNNLGGYKNTFADKGITGSDLLQLSEQDLTTDFGMEPIIDIPRLAAALEWYASVFFVHCPAF